jgi:hypothetical protein
VGAAVIPHCLAIAKLYHDHVQTHPSGSSPGSGYVMALVPFVMGLQGYLWITEGHYAFGDNATLSLFQPWIKWIDSE